jgi:hypothetical protein
MLSQKEFFFFKMIWSFTKLSPKDVHNKTVFLKTRVTSSANFIVSNPN